MQEFEVAIVGGGPAGSTCAWRLRQAGIEVVVLDRESFPRTKLCAGWITPKVVADLELDIGAYPHSFMTFEHIDAHWWRTHVEFPCVQHSIRRWEFDQYLLERSGAPVHQHYVKHIHQESGAYVIDNKFRCRYLIGAAGTKCPVYREFFRDVNPRARALQTVTYEQLVRRELPPLVLRRTAARLFLVRAKGQRASECRHRWYGRETQTSRRRHKDALAAPRRATGRKSYGT
jgi:flavin-dependent dehydrogenase